MGLSSSVELCGSLPGIGGLLERRPSFTRPARRNSEQGRRRTSSGCLCRETSILRWRVATKAPVSQGIDAAGLQACLDSMKSRVRPWHAGSYTFVKTLEASVRNYGYVDLMEDSRDAREVAVKRMPNQWLTASPAEFAQMHRDVYEQPWFDLAVLTELNKRRYPYSCELLRVFRDEECTYVVTSLATQGDLFAWCSAKPEPGPQREALVSPIASQMFSAVRWLHNLGVAHRDLSLENIMLTDSPIDVPQVKLIDFAMATASRTCRLEPRGKPSYQAPEMHREAEYDAFLTDAFALGVCLFALTVQGYPWDSTKPKDACERYRFVQGYGLRKFLELKKLRQCGGRPIIDVLSPGLFELVGGLLEFQPAVRFHLGESCMEAVKSKAWRSVWMTSWLQEPAEPGEQEPGSPGNEAEGTASTRSGDDTDCSSDCGSAEPGDAEKAASDKSPANSTTSPGLECCAAE